MRRSPGLECPLDAGAVQRPLRIDVPKLLYVIFVIEISEAEAGEGDGEIGGEQGGQGDHWAPELHLAD